MAQISQLIAVGDETPVMFQFQRILTSVNVQVRFYNVGGVDLGVVGDRDLVARTVTPYQTPEGVVPEYTDTLQSDVYRGEITATTIGPAIGATWYELQLGAGFDAIQITSPATGAPPAGATHYRIAVDSGPPA